MAASLVDREVLRSFLLTVFTVEHYIICFANLSIISEINYCYWFNSHHIVCTIQRKCTLGNVQVSYDASGGGGLLKTSYGGRGLAQIVVSLF